MEAWIIFFFFLRWHLKASSLFHHFSVPSFNTHYHFFPCYSMQSKSFFTSIAVTNQIFSCLLNSPSKLGSTNFSIIHYTSRSITLRWLSQSSSPVHQLWLDQGWFGTTQTRYSVHDWKQRLQIKTENWGEMVNDFFKHHENQITNPREQWCTWTARVYSNKHTGFWNSQSQGTALISLKCNLNSVILARFSLA